MFRGCVMPAHMFCRCLKDESLHSIVLSVTRVGYVKHHAAVTTYTAVRNSNCRGYVARIPTRKCEMCRMKCVQMASYRSSQALNIFRNFHI